MVVQKNYHPSKEIIKYIKSLKIKYLYYNNPIIAVKGADVIFSDKVISLNDKVNKIKKLKHFKNFKINQKIMNLQKRLHFSSLLAERERS